MIHVRDDGSLDIMASVEVVRNGQALDIFLKTELVKVCSWIAHEVSLSQR